jgi:hypothetical protein
MSNKSFKDKDNQPFDYHKEVEASKKLEKPSTETRVNALRSDMLPASDTSPETKSIFDKINLKIIIGVLVGLVILGWIWFSLAGPGRPILEHNLARLIHLNATSTQHVDPSPLPVTNTSALSSNTLFSTPTVQPTSMLNSPPTVRPTNTPTIKNVASPTLIPATITPTPAPICRDVSTITLDDVGQTLCVRGTVIEIVDNPNYFMLVFSNERGAFYWVSYDIVWSQAEVNTCYQIRGMIRQISNSPILIFDYRNIPEVCP